MAYQEEDFLFCKFPSIRSYKMNEPTFEEFYFISSEIRGALHKINCTFFIRRRKYFGFHSSLWVVVIVERFGDDRPRKNFPWILRGSSKEAIYSSYLSFFFLYDLCVFSWFCFVHLILTARLCLIIVIIERGAILP